MTNSIDKKLQDLTRTDTFKDGAMVLGDAGSVRAFPLILETIDTTILPRLVEFAVGTSSVTVLAGGRRLRALADTSDDLKAPDGLTGKMLSNDDTKELGALKSVLDALIAKSGMLTMKRRDTGKAAGQSDAGVGLQVLVDAWGIDLNAKPPSPLEIFVGALGSDFVASFEVQDGTASAARGNFDVIKIMEAALLQTSGPIHDHLSQDYSDATGRQIIVLDGLLPDGNLMCVLTLPETRALVATSSNGLANCAIGWSRL